MAAAIKRSSERGKQDSAPTPIKFTVSENFNHKWKGKYSV